MSKKTFFKNFFQNWQFILLVTLLLASLTFAVSAIIPPKYESTISVLIIQKQSAEKVDAFSATKSAEYLSQIFSRVLYANRFFREILQSPYQVTNNFPQDPEEWKRAWQKTVKIRKINNTGILKISVLARNRQQAEKLARAIAWNLSQHGQEYHGGGDRVEIKLIDGPITPQDPAWPKIWLNVLLAVLLGLGISGTIIYFFPEKKILTSRRRKYSNYLEFNAKSIERKFDLREKLS